MFSIRLPPEVRERHDERADEQLDVIKQLTTERRSVDMELSGFDYTSMREDSRIECFREIETR